MEVAEALKQTEYAETTRLLAEAAQAYIEGSREVLIICAWEDRKMGLLVDKIVGVDELPNKLSLPAALRSVPLFHQARPAKTGRKADYRNEYRENDMMRGKMRPYGS